MKKTAAFIVRRRYMVLGIVVILTLLCTSLATKVEINSDMTKYLADDSSMKIGMDIMEEEFEDIEESQTIRVMAQGLDEAEKQTLLEALEALPYVSSVDHDESEDYNSGDYSLFVINTEYEYGSEEETAIEAALDEDFGDYDLTWQNDDDSAMSLKPWIIAVAVAFLLIVMLAMCESWIEPFLFLATVGLAVLINAGTNIILGSVSNITNSIAAILQLVLSMDYSIILMNRYRQEQALCADKETAMTRALTHAFSSITSSSLTTIVGLLALVFMSFKIGRDLGLVLAKGVLISLLCIFTALPGMVLACDGLIKKTAKKTLSPPMGGAWPASAIASATVWRRRSSSCSWAHISPSRTRRPPIPWRAWTKSQIYSPAKAPWCWSMKTRTKTPSPSWRRSWQKTTASPRCWAIPICWGRNTPPRSFWTPWTI